MSVSFIRDHSCYSWLISFAVGTYPRPMAVGKDLQACTKARPGDLVRIVLQKDEEERVVTVPKELEDALRKNQRAASTFAKLAPSHKKEYADWISSAKKPDTKISRVQKAIEMLEAGKKRLR
jgi:hypothetical protein